MEVLFKKNKVFCLGQNKTGTTSLQQVLFELGYKIGEQFQGEMLLEDWGKRNFTNIISLCKSADAFQDVPFSLDYTFVILDQTFKNSKFILTIRDTPEQWYKSLVTFHAKITCSIEEIPTEHDIKNYMQDSKFYKNWLWRYNELVYGANSSTLYNKDLYISKYNSHNENVMNYFRFRKNDLLVIKLSEENSYEKVCNFLGHKYNGEKMPCLNKT